MAKSRTHMFWKQWVWRLKKDDPKLSAVEIEQRLQARLKEAPQGSGSPPAARTIRDIVNEPRPRGIRDEEFGSFRWPQSMERGDLPWEAAERCLELLSHVEGERPSVRVAKWFWRVSLAIPNESVKVRHLFSRLAANVELFGEAATVPGAVPLGGERGLQNIDWILAYRPWASAEDLEAFERAGRAHGFDTKKIVANVSARYETPDAMLEFAKAMASAGFGTISEGAQGSEKEKDDNG